MAADADAHAHALRLPPSSIPPAPIALALLPTSRIDQLDHSPPHPAAAFSPDRDYSAAPHRKRHPADLVSLEHPDPHAELDSLDSPDLDSPPAGDGSTTTHGRGSENGVQLSHGSEHGDYLDGGGNFVPPPTPPTTTTADPEDDLQEEVVDDTRPPTNGRARRSSSSAVGDALDLVPAGTDSPTPPDHDQDAIAQPNFVPMVPFTKVPTVTATNAPTVPVTNAPTVPVTNGNETGTAAPQLAKPTRDRSENKSSTEGKKDRERESTSAESKNKERESTRSRRVLGEWTMSKTLGAGSMGKVKLGISSVTGEKVAIKIIPRFTSTAAAYRPPSSSSGGSTQPGSTDKKELAVKPSASFLQKAALKDASKEVRTMREGSLCMLLHHPYVCGMKSMVLYPHHYYMVFEYVNGGQMLDYIISHGRLRERSARKFARQIGSALEYCHANSIVHRDLKIENILISKTGNIKIIDFGLSNLYSPSTHLNTFCGSLYFAAPELLNAKLYTGPEVDVWSFGIVLYVLVCGKVPFDDQSMPALHAKIKRGQVEYPTWLSAECKHLLSRMLVTTPTQRATLAEVLSHPWMIKGFTGPPSPHIPPRVPLRLDDVSRDVIKGMSGFEFGTEAEIEANLVDVLSSDLYRQAVRAWDARRSGTDVDDSPGERPATRVDGKDMKGLGRSPTNKRFSGLGFYGKKFAGAFVSGGAMTRDGETTDSANGSSTTLASGVRVDSLDPTRGFHPLVSIYYLVQEKIEREKIWGPGVFASSTLSLTGPPPPPAPAMAYQAGAGAVRSPELAKPSPAAAETEVLAPPRPSSTAGPMTPQPRPRATGEELLQHPSTAPAAAGQFRSSFSANKRSSFHEAVRPRPTYEPTSPSPAPQGHQRRPSTSGASDYLAPDDVPLAPATPSGFVRRFGSLLGRSTPPSPESYKGHRQRASIGGTAHKASNKTTVSALPQVSETGSLPTGGSDVPLPSPPEGQSVTRSSTVGELSPNRHHRGVSMGAAPSPSASLGRASGAQERRRQVSLGTRSSPPPRQTGAQAIPIDERAEELVETEGDELEERLQQDVGFVGRTAPSSGAEGAAKPVWLKGLFSVSTTSTKSSATIRADLVKVLDRLGVQHRDVKSGFECAHVPSIDLSSVGKRDVPPTPTKGTIRRRASKLLLNAKDPTSGVGEESQVSLGAEPKERAPSAQTATSSTSFTVLAPLGSPTEPVGSTVKSPIPGTPARFNSSTNEGSVMSNDLIVRFEVFVVRMPLLPGIHGLQFRRIAGNAWQYQMLARRVLSELKL